MPDKKTLRRILKHLKNLEKITAFSPFAAQIVGMDSGMKEQLGKDIVELKMMFGKTI
jgi:hypothetical protein